MWYMFAVLHGDVGRTVRLQLTNLNEIVKVYNNDLRPLVKLFSESAWERCAYMCRVHERRCLSRVNSRSVRDQLLQVCRRLSVYSPCLRLPAACRLTLQAGAAVRVQHPSRRHHLVDVLVHVRVPGAGVLRAVLPVPVFRLSAPVGQGRPSCQCRDSRRRRQQRSHHYPSVIAHHRRWRRCRCRRGHTYVGC